MHLSDRDYLPFENLVRLIPVASESEEAILNVQFIIRQALTESRARDIAKIKEAISLLDTYFTKREVPWDEEKRHAMRFFALNGAPREGQGK
jgi:hypothetical protein